MKMTTNMIRSERSPIRWERRWAKYILKEWHEETEVLNFDAKHLVYNVTTLFHRGEYAGQTGNGLPVRGRGHMRRAAKGKQKGRFYRWLERVGLHQAIYTPMHMSRCINECESKDESYGNEAAD